MAPTITWRDPWLSLEGRADQQGELDAELAKEIPSDHVLANRVARAIGRRRDVDDVVYLLDGGPEYAVVHLTWCGRQGDARWPATVILPDADTLQHNCIDGDAALAGLDAE